MSDDGESIKELLDPKQVSMDSTEYDRLTMTMNVYFEQFGEEPVGLNVVSSMVVESCGEECYRRRLAVGDQWESLDLGWLEDKAGAMVLNNRMRQVNLAPTQPRDEVATFEDLLVSFDGGQTEHVVIPAGSAMLLTPLDPAQVRVRARKERTRVELLVTPK